MPVEPAFTFGATADEEHRFILEAKTHAAEAARELGFRLRRFRESGEWHKVTPPNNGEPWQDFTDYLDRGVNLSRTTLYKYMDASVFPLWCFQRFGSEKLAFLKRITDLTAVDESVDQAIALELPVADGQTKPFEKMSAEEVERALKLMRDGQGKVKRTKLPEPEDSPLVELQQRAAQAVAEWLTPRQVMARRLGKDVVLDVDGVPRVQAADVFTALATTLDGEQPQKG